MKVEGLNSKSSFLGYYNEVKRFIWGKLHSFSISAALLIRYKISISVTNGPGTFIIYLFNLKHFDFKFRNFNVSDKTIFDYIE